MNPDYRGAFVASFTGTWRQRLVLQMLYVVWLKAFWGLIADTLAKQLTEQVMGAFGIRTEAQKNQDAIEAGGETVRASWEELFQWFASQQEARKDFVGYDPNSPDIKGTFGSSILPGSPEDINSLVITDVVGDLQHQ